MIDYLKPDLSPRVASLLEKLTLPQLLQLSELKQQGRSLWSLSIWIIEFAEPFQNSPSKSPPPSADSPVPPAS